MLAWTVSVSGSASNKAVGTKYHIQLDLEPSGCVWAGRMLRSGGGEILGGGVGGALCSLVHFSRFALAASWKRGLAAGERALLEREPPPAGNTSLMRYSSHTSYDHGKATC